MVFDVLALRFPEFRMLDCTFAEKYDSVQMAIVFEWFWHRIFGAPAMLPDRADDVSLPVALRWPSSGDIVPPEMRIPSDWRFPGELDHDFHMA